MRLAFAAAVALFAFAATQPARATQEPAAFHDVDGGWQEAWVGVSDIGRMRTFFETVAGWRAGASGEIDAATLAYIAPGATGGRYLVMDPPDYPQGAVRLIELTGVERRIIRANAQAWDAGGVFSIMTRSADLERNLRDAEKLGWTALSEPYDFGFDSAQFGRLQLRNIVLRGPDGVNVAIYEWVAPKLAGAPPAGALSKAFNSMQMVADLDAAKGFYVGALGFRVIQEGAFVDPAPTMTNFALPVNYATKVPRKFLIVIPKNGNDAAGRVELMRFDGFEGRALGGRAALDQLGVVGLVYPVSDLGAVRRLAREKRLKIVRAPAAVSLPPYGSLRAMTVSSPEGALLTFVSRR